MTVQDLAAPAAPSELSVVGQISEVDPILEVCLEVTGMGYAVVAHVTEDRWLACAVRDQIAFGLPVGGELPIKTTLCNEVRETRQTIAFDHASADETWRGHHTPISYGLESYIAVPIILEDGEFFGTLCAIDPKPAPASRPQTIKMFQLFSQLIASQIDAQRRVSASVAALLDEREAAEIRDQFIAVLGHDLRNPLAAVEGGARLLERRLDRPDADKILAEMKRATGRMGRLINDVLDFARGRLGGGLTAIRRPSRLAPILNEVVDEARAANPGRVVATSIELAEEIDCDPDRIAQLASNLLANALAHGDPAAPVYITAKLSDATFLLSVTNSGAPIPPEVQARLFQPFSRRHTGEVRDGLGLGLYISSQIAAAHGGQLRATSTSEETRFELRLPLG